MGPIVDSHTANGWILTNSKYPYFFLLLEKIDNLSTDLTIPELLRDLA